MNNNNNNISKNSIVMDVEQLHVILQQSFASEASVRQPAEEIIRHLKHVQGATVLLLQVVSEKQVRKQSHSINMFVQVKRSWWKCTL